MAKAVKLSDIAEQLGVSTVTVSKALSGQKGVSEEMRQKIVELADELGYKQPSAIKKEMEDKKSYNFAVLIHERYFDKYDSFYLQLYKQLAQRAIAMGCFTLLETVSQAAEEGCEVPMVVQEKKADAVIIVGRFEKKYAEFLSEKLAGIPYIYLDYCDMKKDTDSVISDSFYGAYSMTNYLFDMGHRNIGYLGTVLTTGSITDRYLGYLKSLMEHGITEKKEWIIKDRDEKTGKMFLPEEIELPEEMPTAFMCNCDLAASLLIKRLNEAGYRVPEDISVAGYDNYLYPGLSDIEITTYEVDIRAMAKNAICRLLRKMSDKDYKGGISIVEGRLVIKDSVKKIG